MVMLAFDPQRLESLRSAMAAALDELRRLGRDDSATAEAAWAIRSATRSLADVWLPRVNDVLQSKSMTSPMQSKLHDYDRRMSIPNLTGTDPLWQIISDPGGYAVESLPKARPVYGPAVPGSRSFGEVMQGIHSGALSPMTPPLDANGRAGAHYTSLAFTPAQVRQVGHADMTSGWLKFLDFMSDGLPVGWREQKGIQIIYLQDARVTSRVHVLTAYDRDSGPETLLDQTTEATVSGYLVLREDTSVGEVNVDIGPGDQDPTLSYPIISESVTEYSGAFYPNNPPDFQPLSPEPRFVNAPLWIFTTSASPMVDGWGTWRE